MVDIFAPLIPKDLLEAVWKLKEARGRLSNLKCDAKAARFVAGKRPWKLLKKVDVALPCATQNKFERS
jgi:glutamate dehydrogenase (NADP+)